MPTVEEKLQSLHQSQKLLRSQKTKTWKEKQKAEKEYQSNQRAIADLEKYQQLQVNDWVTNQKEVGQIVQLNLTSGGMPQVWISWDDSLASPEHRLDKLILLEDNWNHGLSKGDLCLNRGIHQVTIVRFAWCENTSSVQPIVAENGEERFAHFDNLSPSNGKGESESAPSPEGVSPPLLSLVIDTVGELNKREKRGIYSRIEFANYS